VPLQSRSAKSDVANTIVTSDNSTAQAAGAILRKSFDVPPMDLAAFVDASYLREIALQCVTLARNCPHLRTAQALEGLSVELMERASELEKNSSLEVSFAGDIRRLRTIHLYPRPALTDGERAVLAWAAQGKSAWEIGKILSIPEKTVSKRTHTAFEKLGAVNKTHAVAVALRDGLI
jgi:DNA-binding CsgD family transcriptional regulator